MIPRRAAALGFLAALSAVIIVIAVLHRVGTATRATTGNTYLVPSRDASLYIVRASGGKPKSVAGQTKLPFDAEEPAWSADGTSIAFTGTACEGCASAIYVLDLRDMRVRRLTSGSYPAWSRRGSIAFVRRGADGIDRIYLMRPDGRKTRALFSSGASGSQPTWSPDGTKIAFVRLVGDPQHGNSQIFIANVNGTGVTDLAHDPSAVENTPEWSPDGTRIAFSNLGSRGYWEVYLMGTDGTDKQKLVSLAANVSAPTWSPDGTRLVFMSDAARQTGLPSLYIVRADGRGLVRLTSGPTEDVSPAWSRNGERIAFSRRPLVRIVDRTAAQ